MKIILLSILYLSINTNDGIDNLSCNSSLLKYYGLEGLTVPMEYKDLGELDTCKGIHYSCCSIADFDQTKEFWSEKSKNIKGYLQKMFSIIEKTAAMQSSLMNLANRIKDKDSIFCREVDFTFFNEKIKFEMIYLYIKNGLESFAQLQTGFYCLLCDAQSHKFLNQDMNSMKITKLNPSFCTNLIDIFREYLLYKVYYIDPIIINSNFLFNCYRDTSQYQLDFYYKATIR